MRSFVLLLPLLSALSFPASAAEIVVRMEGADYTPTQIEARVGDRLVFMNDDVVEHEVFVPTAGHGIDLGKQAPGQTVTMSLGKSGRFDVECVFHPQMLLSVDVKQ